MKLALEIVSTRDLLELELVAGNHSPLLVIIPNPRIEQYWSQQLYKDQNVRVTISAQASNLRINDQKRFVVIATITVADMDTAARLASWLIVTEPENRDRWFPQIFDSSLQQSELEEKLNPRSDLREYVVNA